MTKNFTLLAFLIFWCNFSFAQFPEVATEVTFTQDSKEYVPLEEYIDLVEDEYSWFGKRPILDLDNPFQFPGNRIYTLDEIEISLIGFLEFRIPVDTALDGYTFFDFETLAPGMEVQNPRVSPLHEDNGYVLFYQSEDSVVIEFRNVANFFEVDPFSEDFGSRFNLQVIYFLNEPCFEFHYGPSTISEDAEEYYYYFRKFRVGFFFGYDKWGFDGQSSVFLYNKDHFRLSGDPKSPELLTISPDEAPGGTGPFSSTTGLDSFPPEGTVYRFCFDQTTSTEEIAELSGDLTLYPNPTTDMVYFSLPEEDANRMGDLNVQVIDLSGNVVIESEFGTDLHGGLNVEMLPAGIYFVRLTGENLSKTVKMVKK